MSDGTRIEYEVAFTSGRRGRRLQLRRDTPEHAEIPAGNIPRVSRLMALAIHLDELIRAGELRDWAEVARVGHVTRARATQVANLLLLAPDVQLAILDLLLTVKGRDPISERDLRPIAAEPDWAVQRQMWAGLVSRRRC